ncbi:MAG: L,D-transpeptidase family protein [Phycisphaeraceae bacterium]|nr:L,D-transpeptidase family protein [Phycisphaeraceae bacterium]
MALASQTIPAQGRSRYMSSSRRRRGRRGGVVVAVALLALAGGTWAMVKMFGTETPSEGVPAPQTPLATVDPPARPTRSGSWVTPEPEVVTSGVAAGRIETPKPPANVPSLPDRATAPLAGAESEATPPKGFDAPAPPVSSERADDDTSRSNAPAPGARAASSELARALALTTSDPIAARLALTRLLDGSALTGAERLRAYEAINEVNQPLFFRSGLVQGDTVFRAHRVQQGETPTAIVRSLQAECEPDLLLRVNEIRDARRIRPGQVLKVPTGTFHAEVLKGEYRLNVYHGEGADRVMIASYPVGLGESNTTPTGIFKVRPRSKLKNPQWTNPRTGEFFAADDPKNPIGERWIGIEGIEPHNRDFLAYGIHGTIEPESIGQMRSMGCVRMRELDVEVVFELLTVPNSTILIAP